MAAVGIRADSQGTIQPARHAGFGGCILRMAGKEGGKEANQELRFLTESTCLLKVAAGFNSALKFLTKYLIEQHLCYHFVQLNGSTLIIKLYFARLLNRCFL